MFGVNERRQSAGLLGVGDDVQHERRFAGGFRPENFHNATARHAADAQRQVERERAGGNHINPGLRAGVAQPHDASLAVGFGDAGYGGVQLALAGDGNSGGLRGFCFDSGFFHCFCGHKILLRFLIRNSGRARASQLLP